VAKNIPVVHEELVFVVAQADVKKSNSGFQLVVDCKRLGPGESEGGKGRGGKRGKDCNVWISGRVWEGGRREREEGRRRKREEGVKERL
jgi:hypothetical protein